MGEPMRTTRRGHLVGLACAGVVGFTPARSQDAGPFVGVWSAAFIDDHTGLAARVRLEITPVGKATITFIDIGNVPFAATRVRLTPPTFAIAWENIGFSLAGALKDPVTIVARPSGPAVDKPENQTFKRGDLYPVNTTVLPHAVMSAERLHQLRMISGAPAMGVAYAFKNQQDHILVEGLRSTEADVSVAPTDRWHIGSCTKSMTATLSARLVEAGRISWTDTIGAVLGRQVKDIHPSYRDANLLHLLSHHAGLLRDPPGVDAFGHGKRANLHGERLLYAAKLLRETPLGPIGKTESYSNGGFVVAGLMLEMVTGKTWEALIRELLFNPLGLKSAGFGPPTTAAHLDSPLGHGHDADGKLFPPNDPKITENPPPVANPCGGVHIGLGDFLTYLKAHRDHPASFLSEASWKTLRTPPFGGFSALGFGITGDGGLQHSGSNGLWWAQISVAPWGPVFAGVQNAATPEVISVMSQAQDAAARSWD